MPPPTLPPTPKKRNRKKHFSSKCHVKFGNLVIFSGKYHVKSGHFVLILARLPYRIDTCINKCAAYSVNTRCRSDTVIFPLFVLVRQNFRRCSFVHNLFVVATFTPRRSYISSARFTRSPLLASRLPAGCRSALWYTNGSHT